MNYLEKILFAGVVLAGECCCAQAASPYQAVVAADGSGDYLTVGEAIAAAPAVHEGAWKILVKRGEYRELVKIPAEKRNIHLIGEGRDKTIIHHPINYGGAPDANPRYRLTDYWKWSKNNPESSVAGDMTAVVDVRGDGFLAWGIGFVNDWGVESWSGPQALAMYSNADRVAFGECALRSFQDTWRTPDADSHRNYAGGCLIEGAVDYIYGGGDVFVEGSTLYNVRSGSVIVAPNHGDPEWGYVFRDCVIDGNFEAADGKQKLGRPWQRKPRAVYINTIALIPITEGGWDEMGTIPGIFAEYNTVGRDGKAVDLSRRKTHYKPNRRGKNGEDLGEGDCQAVLTPEQAAGYTYSNVVAGKDGWDPRAMMTRLARPANLRLEGETLSWDKVEGAIGYMVYDGEKLLGVTDECALKVSGHPQWAYMVKAVNPSGIPGKTGV